MIAITDTYEVIDDCEQKSLTGRSIAAVVVFPGDDIATLMDDVIPRLNSIEDSSSIQTLIAGAVRKGLSEYGMNQDSFEKLAKCTLNLLDLSVEVRCVHINDGSAPAGESLVRLEPSDRLGRISSAITAGDIDTLIAEHVDLLEERLLQPSKSHNEGTSNLLNEIIQMRESLETVRFMSSRHSTKWDYDGLPETVVHSGEKVTPSAEIYHEQPQEPLAARREAHQQPSECKEQAKVDLQPRVSLCSRVLLSFWPWIKRVLSK